MKTIKKLLKRLWRSVLSIEIEVAIAIATIGLLPICLSASKHWAGYYSLMVVISFIVVAVIVWRKWMAKKSYKS